jgi:hypothetical protein
MLKLAIVQAERFDSLFLDVSAVHAVLAINPLDRIAQKVPS